MVPDRYVADGFKQVTLSELHKHDETQYMPFVEYCKVGVNIAGFVERVNEATAKLELQR